MNGKILPIALAVSLTVNVFVVGAAVGALGARARFMPHRPPPGAGMGGGGGGGPIMRAADDLPTDVATAYRQRMRTEAEASRPLLQDARAARQAAAEAFSQPTFDKAGALAALAKSRSGETAAREKLETAVVEFAANLPQDQRSLLSRALRQPPRGGGPGGRRGGPGMGGGPGLSGPGGPPFDGGPQGGEPR